MNLSFFVVCSAQNVVKNQRFYPPRMLGYGAGTFTRESQFGNVPGGDFGMDDVKCSGSETDIRDCRHVTSDDCGAGEAAGVICSDFQGSDGESPSAAVGQ